MVIPIAIGSEWVRENEAVWKIGRPLTTDNSPLTSYLSYYLFPIAASSHFSNN